MKLVFASDSFKGTVSSEQTVELLTKAAHEVFGPCETVGVPVADGGEGTTDAVILARKGKRVFANVAESAQHNDLRNRRTCQSSAGRGIYRYLDRDRRICDQ